MTEALGNEKAVGSNTQGGVVVEALPAPALVMRETELLLEFLIVPFDAPAHLGDKDQLRQCGLDRGGGEEVFCRLGFTFRPFDQQPLFGAHFGAEIIPVSGTEARYIGEVGLDAGPRFFKSFDLQKQVFEHVLRRCAEAGNKVISGA